MYCHNDCTIVSKKKLRELEEANTSHELQRQVEITTNMMRRKELEQEIRRQATNDIARNMMTHHVANSLGIGPTPHRDDIINVHHLIRADPEKTRLYSPVDDDRGIQKTKEYLNEASQHLGPVKTRPPGPDLEFWQKSARVLGAMPSAVSSTPGRATKRTPMKVSGGKRKHKTKKGRTSRKKNNTRKTPRGCTSRKKHKHKIPRSTTK